MLHEAVGEVSQNARAAALRRRSVLLWAAGLALLVLATRVLFRAGWLYHWDSVNYALGMQHFDMRLHQPHPPGYFFYIALADVVDLLVGDANASLVWLSVAFSAVGAALLFLLGREMLGVRVAVIAALLYVSSPNIWFHGEVALPRSIEAFFSIAIALMCYRLMRGDARYFLPAALMLAVAGGFRQQVLIFLLPLWVWAGWGQPLRRWAAAAALGVGVTLLWLLPTFALSGGFESGAGVMTYLWSQGGLSSETGATGLALVALKIARVGVYTFYGLTLGVLAFLYVPAWRRAWRARRTRNSLFLLIWLTPALLVTFNWVEQPGHVLVFLPPLFLLVGEVVMQVGQAAASRWRGAPATWTGALTAVLVVANVAFFLFAPSPLLGREGTLTIPPAAQTIAARDRFLSTRVAAIRATFSPETTTVIGGGRYFRHPDYYLADYQYPALNADLTGTLTYLPEHVDTLVLFTDDLRDQVAEGVPVASLALADGATLHYIEAGAGQVFGLSGTTITLADADDTKDTANDA
ncbi:MAG: hypothetical protein Kow00120_28420 [Anaerolineae bacterium]